MSKLTPALLVMLLVAALVGFAPDEADASETAECLTVTFASPEDVGSSSRFYYRASTYPDTADPAEQFILVDGLNTSPYAGRRAYLEVGPNESIHDTGIFADVDGEPAWDRLWPFEDREYELRRSTEDGLTLTLGNTLTVGLVVPRVSSIGPDAHLCIEPEPEDEVVPLAPTVVGAECGGLGAVLPPENTADVTYTVGQWDDAGDTLFTVWAEPAREGVVLDVTDTGYTLGEDGIATIDVTVPDRRDEDCTTTTVVPIVPTTTAAECGGVGSVTPPADTTEVSYAVRPVREGFGDPVITFVVTATPVGSTVLDFTDTGYAEDGTLRITVEDRRDEDCTPVTEVVPVMPPPNSAACSALATPTRPEDTTEITYAVTSVDEDAATYVLTATATASNTLGEASGWTRVSDTVATIVIELEDRRQEIACTGADPLAMALGAGLLAIAGTVLLRRTGPVTA